MILRPINSTAWLLVLVLSWIPLLVRATPIPAEKRQSWTGMWSEELSYTGCKPVIFIFARETIAPGNMVRLPTKHQTVPSSTHPPTHETNTDTNRESPSDRSSPTA